MPNYRKLIYFIGHQCPGGIARKMTSNNMPENEKKWTKAVMSAGWTAFPSVILERQRELKLDSVEVNILLHLAKFWWSADKLPFPSKSTIASCIGVAPRTVQRKLASLETAKYINRIPRFSGSGSRMSNSYSLEGLIKAVTPLAEEELNNRIAKSGRRKNSYHVVQSEFQGGGLNL